MKARKKIPGKKKSEDEAAKYRFTLFVAGNEPNSESAERMLKGFCEKYLHEPYKINVVDVFKDYKSAIENRIIVVPTLIIEEPGSNLKTVAGKPEDEKTLIEILGLRIVSK